VAKAVEAWPGPRSQDCSVVEQKGWSSVARTERVSGSAARSPSQSWCTLSFTAERQMMCEFTKCRLSGMRPACDDHCDIRVLMGFLGVV
jgi:hypothetical protein